MFPSFHFVKNIQKKIMTAGNSPGHSRIKDILSKDINTNHKKNNDKISFQNVKQTLLKDVINKNYKNKATNLKSAYVTRKNSKNKDGYKNIMSEYKLNKNYNDIYYNESNPNNSLRSLNSLNKDNKKNIMPLNFNSNYNIKKILMLKMVKEYLIV
jgi:hypothetical protein